MRTVPIDTLDEGQVVRLPADMAYEGVEELAISREGDVVTLRLRIPSHRDRPFRSIVTDHSGPT